MDAPVHSGPHGALEGRRHPSVRMSSASLETLHAPFTACPSHFTPRMRTPAHCLAEFRVFLSIEQWNHTECLS